MDEPRGRPLWRVARRCPTRIFGFQTRAYRGARAANCRCAPLASFRLALQVRHAHRFRSNSKLSRGAAKYGRSNLTFTSWFDALKTELLPSDEAALHSLIASWRGAREITIRATGHADAQPISAPQSQSVRRQLRPVERPRAQAVVELSRDVAQRPGKSTCTSKAVVPTNRCPRGKDPASLAANRRVEIVIEGSRFEANAPLEILDRERPAADNLDTAGVVLRGPGIVQGSQKRKGPRASATIGPRRRRLDVGETGAWHCSGSTPRTRFRGRRLPSIKLAIQHEPGQVGRAHPTTACRWNPLNFDGTSLNESNSVALSRWRA